MCLVLVAGRLRPARRYVMNLYSNPFMLRNQSRDCSFCCCLFAVTRKKWVTLELLRIMWLTCLSIFHRITQTMACPVLVWTCSNVWPVPQEHCDAGCTTQHGGYEPLAAYLQCDPTLQCPVGTPWPFCGLDLVCCCSPELMGNTFCAGRSTQSAAHSFYPAKGQGPAEVLPHVGDEGRIKGSGGAGVSVSLRTRGGRYASGALSSGGHHGGLSPEVHPGFLLRSAYYWATPLQYAASDHAELLLKKHKCLVVSSFSGSSIVMMSPAAVGILHPLCFAKCVGALCLAMSVVSTCSSVMRLMRWSVQ